jgi:hypothetical protein
VLFEGITDTLPVDLHLLAKCAKSCCDNAPRGRNMLATPACVRPTQLELCQQPLDACATQRRVGIYVQDRPSERRDMHTV